MMWDFHERERYLYNVSHYNYHCCLTTITTIVPLYIQVQNHTLMCFEMSFSSGLASSATAATFMASFLISPWTPWSSTANIWEAYMNFNNIIENYYTNDITKTHEQGKRELTVTDHFPSRASSPLWNCWRHCLKQMLICLLWWNAKTQTTQWTHGNTTIEFTSPWLCCSLAFARRDEIMKAWNS